MIAVYRGFGPLESAQRGIEGFDAWLLSEAIAAGVRFEPTVVNKIETGVDGEARLSTTDGMDTADFVIGAFAHNRHLAESVVTLSTSAWAEPTVQGPASSSSISGTTSARRPTAISTTWSSSERLYPQLNVWFAAFVPKRESGQRGTDGQTRRYPSRCPGVLRLAAGASLASSGGGRKRPQAGHDPHDLGGHLQCVCTKNTVTVSPPSPLPAAGQRRHSPGGRRRADAALKRTGSALRSTSA